MPKSMDSASDEQQAYQLLPVHDKSETARDENSCNVNQDEREGPYLLTGLQSGMLIFKFCVGAGWFSLPSAFRYSGFLGGIVCVFLCGALTIYGMHRLIETSWEVARRTGTKTAFFGDLGAACGRLLNEKWALVGRLIVEISLVVGCICMLCPMQLFIANLWKQAFEEHDIVKMDMSFWTFIVFVAMFPSTFIRRHDLLALSSIFANILLAVTAVSLFVHIFSNTSNWTVDNTVTWSKLPISIGVVFFAFEIAPFILLVENATRKPKKLPFVINFIMGSITVLYAFIGAVGYASCFPKCRDTILLNLPSSWYYSVVKILMGISASLGGVLIAFVGYEVVEPILKDQVPENRFYLVSLLFRVLVLTFSSGVSASVPQLGNVMALCTSFITALVGFILPAVSHTLLLYSELSRFAIAANLVFLLFGLVLLFAGVYTSLVQIVHNY